MRIGINRFRFVVEAQYEHDVCHFIFKPTDIPAEQSTETDLKRYLFTHNFADSNTEVIFSNARGYGKMDGLCWWFDDVSGLFYFKYSSFKYEHLYYEKIDEL